MLARKQSICAAVHAVFGRAHRYFKKQFKSISIHFMAIYGPCTFMPILPKAGCLISDFHPYRFSETAGPGRF